MFQCPANLHAVIGLYRPLLRFKALVLVDAIKELEPEIQLGKDAEGP
jgi:hypothetical protein